jgi:hypothetical protein
MILMKFTVVGLYYTTASLANQRPDDGFEKYYDAENKDFLQFQWELWCLEQGDLFYSLVENFIIGISVAAGVHLILRMLPRKVRPRRLKPVYSYG